MTEAGVAVTGPERASDRRRRFLARIGPHKQVSDTRVIDVAAEGDVAAHKDYLVTTACGREVASTLATRQDDRVRCPDCQEAMQSEALPAQGAAAEQLAGEQARA